MRDIRNHCLGLRANEAKLESAVRTQKFVWKLNPPTVKLGAVENTTHLLTKCL